MKRRSICLLMSMLVLLGCVTGESYDVPVIGELEPNLERCTKISFESVIGAYQYGGTTFTADDYIEAYVVSSDREGNVYKMIYVQDAAEFPKFALRIDVDMTNTYLVYEVGRKIYVKLKGLTIDKVNGVLVLGVLSNTGFSRIPAFTVQEQVLRAIEVKDIKPVELSLADLSQLDIAMGVLVIVNEIQFDDVELGESYAYPGTNYSVNRELKSCEGNDKIILRNSGYASFKSHPLPEGSGSVIAILTQYNSAKQLIIRSTLDVQLSGERCN